jgi:hypothetical protein
MSLLIYIIYITIIILTYILSISFIYNVIFFTFLTIIIITRTIEGSIIAMKKFSIFLFHYIIYIPGIVYLLVRISIFVTNFFDKFNTPC